MLDYAMELFVLEWNAKTATMVAFITQAQYFVRTYGGMDLENYG